MQNDYGTLVEKWKVDLIVARAKRQGLRDHEIEDAQQDIILDILAFEYAPEKSNGAAEATVLTALIDKKLMFMKRGMARRKKHEDRYCDIQGAVGEYVDPVLCDEGEQDHISMAMDVGAGVESLDERERIVCKALTAGKSRVSIARKLGLTRYQLDEIINGIRQRFDGMALAGWVGK